MTEAERIARAGIERTLAAATQAGDARRADAYAACFAPDGVLQLTREHAGREAIRAFMAAPSVIPQPGAAEQRGYVSHHLTTCRIEMTGPATASVRTYWMVVTAIGLDHSGYYDDRFVAVGDAWLISRRRPRTLWFSPASLIVRAAEPGPSGA